MKVEERGSILHRAAAGPVEMKLYWTKLNFTLGMFLS